MRVQSWMVTILVDDSVTLNEVEAELHKGIVAVAGNPEAIVEIHLSADRNADEYLKTIPKTEWTSKGKW